MCDGCSLCEQTLGIPIEQQYQHSLAGDSGIIICRSIGQLACRLPLEGQLLDLVSDAFILGAHPDG